jgi:hypothetical protein
MSNKLWISKYASKEGIGLIPCKLERKEMKSEFHSVVKRVNEAMIKYFEERINNDRYKD